MLGTGQPSWCMDTAGVLMDRSRRMPVCRMITSDTGKSPSALANTIFVTRRPGNSLMIVSLSSLYRFPSNFESWQLRVMPLSSCVAEVSVAGHGKKQRKRQWVLVRSRSHPPIPFKIGELRQLGGRNNDQQQLLCSEHIRSIYFEYTTSNLVENTICQ